MSDGSFDVAIIGSGPAGLAAAIEAAGCGLSVAVFDEQAHEGGQIYRGVSRASAEVRAILGKDYARGAGLVEQFRQSGAAHISRASVAYVTDELELGVVRKERIGTYRCRSMIVATGALERPFPIPGWTLPGVITAGGVQILLKSGGLIPEGRIAIAGTGPLTYLIAAQLLAAGARDLVFLDTTAPGNRAAAVPLVFNAMRRIDYLVKGAKLLARARAGARQYVGGIRSVEALGERRVQRVRFETSGGTREVEVDWLMLHQGVVPNTQLTRALGLSHAWNPGQLCWHPVLDEWHRSSRKNVFVAGDSATVLGAEAAEHSGRLAALQIATDLGRLSAEARNERAREPRAKLAGLAQIRRFLDRLYRPADNHRIPAGPTIVCRCEDVRADEALAAIAEGCAGPNQLKFFTRCGMGPCQGRYCGLTVTELIAHATGKPIEDVGYYRIRQPLKPVKLGVLATVSAPIEKAAPYKT